MLFIIDETVLSRYPFRNQSVLCIAVSCGVVLKLN